MTDIASSTPPAGWYDDPSDSQGLRWWDGSGWTANAMPKPAAPAEDLPPTGPSYELDRVAMSPRRAARAARGEAPLAPVTQLRLVEAEEEPLDAAPVVAPVEPSPVHGDHVGGAVDLPPVADLDVQHAHRHALDAQTTSAAPVAAPAATTTEPVPASLELAPTETVPPAAPVPAPPAADAPQPTDPQAVVPPSAALWAAANLSPDAVNAPTSATPQEIIGYQPEPVPDLGIEPVPFPSPAEAARLEALIVPDATKTRLPTSLGAIPEPAAELPVSTTSRSARDWRSQLLPRRSTTVPAWLLAFAPEGAVLVLAGAYGVLRSLPSAPIAAFAIVVIGAVLAVLLAHDDRRTMSALGWEARMPFIAILGTPPVYLLARQFAMRRAGGRIVPLLAVTVVNVLVVGSGAAYLWLTKSEWILSHLQAVLAAAH